MKIKSVTIENFRCFDTPLVVNFENYSGLVGKNGTGKTSVLEAINLATSQYYVSSRINESDFNNEENIRIIVEFDKCFVMLIPDGFASQYVPSNRIYLAISRRSKAAAGKALNDGYTINHFAIPYTYSSSTELSDVLEDSMLNGQESLDKLPNSVLLNGDEDEYKYKITRKSGTVKYADSRSLQLSNNMIGFPNVFYFDKDREGETSKKFNNLMSRILDDLNWRYLSKTSDETEILQSEESEGEAVMGTAILEQLILDVWEEYYNKVIGTVEKEKSKRIIYPLKKKMKDFWGEMYEDLELSVLDLTSPFSSGFFSLRKQKKSKQIKVNNLGSGESMILAYFLLQTISKLSKERVIYLIDEPEMHLHPQAQVKLFDEIQKSKNQVIYTTHSDMFVDIGAWKSILRFSPEEVYPTEEILNDKSIEDKAISEHLEEIKQFHQDKTIFVRENNEIFFADKCLLVEGPIDKYGNAILAKKLSKEFQNTTIVSCTGKTKILYYVLLCKAFGIPYFVIYDQDEEGKYTLLEDNSDNIESYTTSFEKVFEQGEEARRNDILTYIINLDKENIPEEVVNIIQTISTWSDE
ncbi:hypothetical protein CVU76_01035 [Candidatus Dojkabacteria bacterium HGW-Dojkabacteria-1]|uniref:Uncharacterized protein n=1 Tax=Candidatus Dojkabacteria bacterium HGW-Dojkabacteria-1 TaxID=2013761 RepID=A0A2N2F361_9BACT|nr:MAG: hypothetical protein CVU76_01035 [Candidatus Dojkabacteria bacterium HGW-Dojkabacteria-1]